MFKNRVKLSYLSDLRSVVKVNLEWERKAATDEQVPRPVSASDFNLSGKHDMYSANERMWDKHILPRIERRGVREEVIRRERLRRNPLRQEVEQLQERVTELENLVNA